MLTESPERVHDALDRTRGDAAREPELSDDEVSVTQKVMHADTPGTVEGSLVKELTRHYRAGRVGDVEVKARLARETIGDVHHAMGLDRIREQIARTLPALQRRARENNAIAVALLRRSPPRVEVAPAPRAHPKAS